MIVFISVTGAVLHAEYEEPPFYLVKDLIAKFASVGKSGSSTKEMSQFCDAYFKKARALFQQKKVDEIFFHRYQRILGVVKFIFIDDPEGILRPVFFEMMKPIAMGVGMNITSQQDVGIGTAAELISKELLDLNLMLMHAQDTKLRDRLFSRMSEVVKMADLKMVSGITFRKGEDSPFSGSAVDFYENGNLKEETNFRNGLREGRRVEYDELGQKSGEGMMKNNVKSGIWIYYTGDRVERIENCNPELRQAVQRILAALQECRFAEARQELQGAVRISPLPMLARLQERFAFVQVQSCLFRGKNEEALKYARSWMQEVMAGKSLNNSVRAEACYMFSYCLVNLLRKPNQLPDREKISLLNEGIDAMTKILEYDKKYTSALDFLAEMYMQLAVLQPEKKEEYMALAQKNRQKLQQMLEARRKPETIDTREGIFKTLLTGKTEKTGNAYALQNDRLSDVEQDLLFFLIPPPPPPHKRET